MPRALVFAVFLFISVSALFAEDHRPEHLEPMPDNSEGKAYIALQARVTEIWKANQKLQTQIDALSTSAEGGPTTLEPPRVIKAPSGQPDYPAMTKVLEVRQAELQHRRDDLSAKLFELRSDLPKLPAQPSAQFPWALNPAPADDLLSLFQAFPKPWTRLYPSPDAKSWNQNVDQWVAKNLTPNKTVTFPAVFSNGHARIIPHPLGVENIPAPPGVKPLPPSRRPNSVSSGAGAHRSLELQGCKLDISIVMAENDASKLPEFEPSQPVLITGQITSTRLRLPNPDFGVKFDDPVLRLDLGMTHCTYTPLPLPKPIPIKDASSTMDLGELLIKSPNYNAMGDKVPEGMKAQVGQTWTREQLIGKKISITIRIGNLSSSKFEPKQVAVMGDTQMQVHNEPSRIIVQAVPPDWVMPEGLKLGQTVEVTGLIAQADCDFHLTGSQRITLDNCIFKVVKQPATMPTNNENAYLRKPQRPAN